MNKTFNINLGGYPFAIDEDAYEYIQNYLNTIRRHFAASEGCEEILYDIEVRMAELFQEHLKGRAIISMKEIDEVIMVMGKPEDFGAEPMDDTHYASYRSKKSERTIKTGKRLFRDPDDKKVGGVCSGIAAYLGIEDPLWVRLIFAILFFTGGIGVVTYIILWALIPEASNAGDKLAMRGEPATIQNIAKVVEEELTDLGDKINEWSKDLGSKKKSDESTGPGFRTKTILSEAVNVFGTLISGIVPVLRNIIKPMFITLCIILLSVLGISWAATFVGFSLAAPALMAVGPESDFISYLGVGSLYFTVGLPILGAMLLIARLAFAYRIHKNIRTGIWTVWFLSLFTTMFAGVSTIKENQSNHQDSYVTDYTIADKDIYLMMPEELNDHSFGIHINKLFLDNGTEWAVRDVKLKVEKSNDARVHIKKIISSRGESLESARQNGQNVTNDLNIAGNKISISKYVNVPKTKKYRNQHIEYIIYIPEGKNIILDDNIKECMRSSALFSWDQIYSDLDGLKWTVKGENVFSDVYDEAFHHKKEFSAGNYSKVIIESGFKVVITKSDKPYVRFEGNKDMVNQVSHRNLDGTLTLNMENDEDADGITVFIGTPALELIHLDGVRSALIEGFSQDKLKLISKGTFHDGEKTAINVNASIKDMDILLDGEQDLKMIGSGNHLDIQADNRASITGDKYMVKSVVWRGTDYDDSVLNVTETITAHPDALSNVKLLGNPKRINL